MDPFIAAEEVAGHSVKRCCELFEVSKSAYYERKNGLPSVREVTDAELLGKICQVHAESNGTYGYLRVYRALRDEGEGVGRRRVRRLMCRAGLEGRAKRRFRTTTLPDPDAEAARDLIQRHFGPGVELDTRYVGDITYVMTWEGWAYLATVIDLASRKVVGWALAEHMRTELVEEACRWPSSPADLGPASSFIRTGAVNIRAATTPPWPEPTASCCRSVARASAGTTPWPNRSSPPSSASSSTRGHGRHARDCTLRSSSTSRVGTTPGGCTARSAT